MFKVSKTEPGRISIDEYNQAVDSLGDNITANCEAIFSAESPGEDLRLEDIADHSINEGFYKWFNNCNPSTGNSNPYDIKRWMNFVILCHKKNANLDTDHLERFLKEKPKFYDKELISSLIHDYEYGLNLISQNDRL